MYVARILYPVEVLGPGKRVGIWFCGCPRRCKGCSNPELWEFKESYNTSPEAVFDIINSLSMRHRIDGFTITGGEPMLQAKDLHKLIKRLVTISDDILVYTGYSINELLPEQLDGIAVLIDGEYIEALNNNCILRGSSNQKINILSQNVRRRYESYCDSETNSIQNFMTSDGIISVGIHKPGFINDLNSIITGKGIEKSNE